MSDIEAKVKEIIVEQLGVDEEEVKLEATFVDDLSFGQVLSLSSESRAFVRLPGDALAGLDTVSVTGGVAGGDGGIAGALAGGKRWSQAQDVPCQRVAEGLLDLVGGAPRGGGRWGVRGSVERRADRLSRRVVPLPRDGRRRDLNGTPEALAPAGRGW